MDHGLGVYRNNSIDVLLAMLGVPASTNSVGELDTSDAIIVNGVDLGLQLPTIGGRVMRAKLKGAKLIVIDPRRHRLAEHADCFLQVRPGSDAALYGAMAKVIVDRGLFDARFLKAHCRNVEAFLEAVHAYDVLWAADACGIAPELIEEAAVTYGRAPAAAILFSTGVEASGVEAIQALVNLALLTGNIGKAGGGRLRAHGAQQPPGRLRHGHAAQPAARLRAGGGHRRAPLLRGALGSAPSRQARPGRGAAARPPGARAPCAPCGFADTTRSWRPLPTLRPSFGSSTWSSSSTPSSPRRPSTPTSSCPWRRSARSRSPSRTRNAASSSSARPPTRHPGSRRPGDKSREMAKILGAGWDYATSAEVMREIGRTVPFYASASYENLARDYGRQWPCTSDKPLGTRFLFEEGVTGQPFSLVPIPRPSRPPWASEDYPFTLSFGHSLYYWHQNVLIQHSETLKREYQILLLDYPEGFVDINADDAKRLEIRDGAKVRLVGVAGAAVTWARVTREVKSGMIFVPYFLREVREQLLGEAASSPRGGRVPVCIRLERV